MNPTIIAIILLGIGNLITVLQIRYMKKRIDVLEQDRVN